MFSILMASFNNASYIGAAIQSLIDQTFKDWELIVVDDASTDTSTEIIRQYSDERIRFFQNEKNIGYIGTLKKMISESRGEVLAILDSDDVLDKNALSEINKAYNEHSDCGFIYSNCYYCDENLNIKHLGYSAKIPEGKTNLHVNSVVALRTFKKDIYLKTAGYDERFLHAEDIDLTFKIEEITKLYFVNKPLYYYRVLKRSQTHGFKNEMINRSSVALAKFEAYQRRLSLSIQNLKKEEISEVLFLGIFSGIFSGRISIAFGFLFKLINIHPFFFFDPRFYVLLIKKIVKIIKLKI